MLEEIFDLPDGWVWTTVTEIISDAQSGFASGKKDVIGGIRHLRMNNIGPDCRLNLDSVLTVPNELAKPRYLLQYNDILFCHTNSAKLVGKTALFDLEEDGNSYAFSNHLTRLRVEQGIVPSWLWYVLATLWRERYFENRCKQWVNQAAIERETLLEAPLPLPPSDEQHRIIDKIENLFEQSRTTREALDEIPALLQQFRQSVLAAAFRGDLTTRDPDDEPASVLLERILDERRRRWEDDLRAKGKDPRRYTYEEPAAPDTSDLPELPEGWCWATIGHCTEWTLYGPRFSSADYSVGVPVVRTTDIDARGRVDLSSVPRLPLTEEQIEKYRLEPGDLLVTRSGSIGKCAVFVEADEPCIPGAYLIQFRLFKEYIEPFYLLYFLLSTTGQNRLLAGATSVTQSNVNAPTVKAIPFPFAPQFEQQRVVKRIERLFDYADTLEESVRIARRRLDRLDQSILARAFRGELVPQDPDDEPASVLLERIRAERESQAGQRSSRR